MEKALAVVRMDTGASEALVEEAVELCEGVDAELVLLHVMPEDEYEDRMATRLETGSGGGTFSIDEAEREATHIAKEAGRRVVEAHDVDVEYRGVVGRLERDAIEIAEEEGCDHVFISGRRRSPSGKAFFGDVTQRILLNFDGLVTVSLYDE
jgi:nucleotide-binding universal stress UspA family protein